MRNSTPRPGKSGRPAKHAAARGRPPRKAGSSYHHGDLRHAMLVAAGALIEEEGVDGLSLRECARRAGVSHGAPAHHFGDVRGLLTALAAQSFEMLVTYMDRYEAAAAPAVRSAASSRSTHSLRNISRNRPGCASAKAT